MVYSIFRSNLLHIDGLDPTLNDETETGGNVLDDGVDDGLAPGRIDDLEKSWNSPGPKKNGISDRSN